jgi:hypothetical protein
VRAGGSELGIGPPLAEPLDQVSRQDLPRSSHGLQPRALDDRDAVNVTVFLRHLARTEPDPDLKRGDRVRVSRVPLDRALDVDGGRDRSRRAEKLRFEPVPRPAHHLPAMAGNRRLENRVVVATQVIGPVVPQPTAQPARSDHVGEQDPPHAHRA